MFMKNNVIVGVRPFMSTQVNPDGYAFTWKGYERESVAKAAVTQDRLRRGILQGTRPPDSRLFRPNRRELGGGPFCSRNAGAPLVAHSISAQRPTRRAFLTLAMQALSVS